jgi:hypothetical protein
VAAAAFTFLAVAVLVMHGVDTTPSHGAEVRGAHGVAVHADHHDACADCIPAHHLIAVCVAVVGTVAVRQFARLRPSNGPWWPAAQLRRAGLSTRSAAPPPWLDPPWIRLAVNRR